MKERIIDFIFNKFPYRLLLRLYPLYMKIRKGTIYKKVLAYAEKEVDDEVAQMLPYMKKAGYLKFFYGKWTLKYERSDYPIDLRKKDDAFYVRHKLFNGKIKKLYMPKGKGSGNCKLYYQSLLLDQDIESPHRYLFPENYDYIKKINGTVIDLGAAEGNFALEMGDISQKIICFEPDENMRFALNKTMSDYKSKLEVVDKFVGEKKNNTNNIISLDEFFGDNPPTDISVIKMDIEGAEQDAIRGMKRTLEKNPQAMLLICAYHQPQAEVEIRNLMKDMGYSVINRKGYMYFHEFDNFVEPYHRRGVLEARR